MPYDYSGSLEAGYSLDEIADHIAKLEKVDISVARAAGYSPQEIIDYLNTPHGGLGKAFKEAYYGAKSKLEEEIGRAHV